MIAPIIYYDYQVIFQQNIANLLLRYSWLVFYEFSFGFSSTCLLLFRQSFLFIQTLIFGFSFHFWFFKPFFLSLRQPFMFIEHSSLSFEQSLFGHSEKFLSEYLGSIYGNWRTYFWFLKTYFWPLKHSFLVTQTLIPGHSGIHFWSLKHLFLVAGVLIFIHSSTHFWSLMHSFLVTDVPISSNHWELVRERILTHFFHSTT